MSNTTNNATQVNQNATPQRNGVNWFATTGIGLGMAAIISVFTALGIQGELLARMLRNEPGWTTVAFILALTGVVVGLVGTIRGGRVKRLQWVSFLGVLLLFGGAVVAILVGVTSLGVRDQPTLSIRPLEVTPTSTNDPTPTSVLLQITAGGSYLASRDRMLLRVAAFPGRVTTQAVWNACSNTAGDFLIVADGDVLAAGESGPSTTGTTTNTLTLRVSTGSYRYVCSHVVLSPQQGNASDGRWVTMLVDLNSIGHDATGSTGTR